jgi:hypothetical protein
MCVCVCVCVCVFNINIYNFQKIELIYGGINLGIECGNLNVKYIGLWSIQYACVVPKCDCCVGTLVQIWSLCFSYNIVSSLKK